jgi:hypothetical protein
VTVEIPITFSGRRTRIIIILALLTCFAALKFIHKISNPIFLDSNLVAIGFNYFQFGAVRRGLVGSIVYLTGTSLVAGAYLVYWLSYILFLSLAYLVLRRAPAATSVFAPFVIILAALLLFWSTDIGRTDMLVAAILAGAALAAIGGRIIPASICIAAGVTINEAVAIYGLPLLLAILIDEHRHKDARLSPIAIGGAAIFISFLAATLIPLLPHSDPRIIVKTIRSEIPLTYLSRSTDEAFFSY